MIIPRYLTPAVAALVVAVAVHGAQAAETAESLLANPKRLEIVEAGCKTNASWATADLCREAAQATRIRFQGRGVRYTPHKVDLFPTHSVMSTAAPLKAAQKPRAKVRGRARRWAGAEAKPAR